MRNLITNLVSSASVNLQNMEMEEKNQSIKMKRKTTEKFT
jgi:hypothetical protein